MNLRATSLVLALLVGLAACSKDKEQCHALALAVLEADNAYTELSATAARGNRAGFEKASKEFDAAVAKIGAVEITGKSLAAEGNASTKANYLKAAPKIVPAYRHLLEAVEKNPKLGQKHAGGVAFLLSTDDVPQDVQDADSQVKVAGGVTRSTKCE